MIVRFSQIIPCLIATLMALGQTALAQSNQQPLIFADTHQSVVLVGEVKGFDFSSPETTIQLEVEGSSSQASLWQIVTKSATELRRQGWTSQSLFIGELVQIKGELIPGSRLSTQLDELVRANGQVLRPDQESIFDQLVSGTYQAVPSQSSIQLSFDHRGFSRSIFYFNNFDAQLELNAEQLDQSQFQLDLLTEDLDSSSFELTRVLKSGAFFDASNFPLISVVATSIERLGDSSLLVRAEIRIKGISQTAQFEIQLNRSDLHPETGTQAIGFSGSAQVRRSDWGFVDYLPDISDQINIDLQMEFALPPEPQPAGYPYNQL